MVYGLYWFAEGGFDRIAQICNNHQNGYLLITNSWFVIAIAVFYLIFFLSFNWCRGDFRKGIRYTLIGICLYIGLAYLAGLGGWWFYSSLSFALGMIWKEHEARINQIAEKKRLLFLAGWGCLFVVGYAFRFINSRTIHSPVAYDIALLIASTAFTGLIFTLLKRITLENKLWLFLGNIAFEIYLIHELIYNVLRNKNLGIYVSDDLMYVGLVILISVDCAYLFNKLITKKLISKILR